MRRSPIQTLDDYLLLNAFYLYRLDDPDEYETNGMLNSNWGGQRWWYKLAQVCRRWRHLILASPLRLDLHLLCTHGVPIADMLAHSPPLPLTIYYDEDVHETTEEDEEGILLALGHSDRVHYICLYLPAPKLRKIIPTMDEEFPILERFYIQSLTEDDTNLVLPRTFQASHLRHLGMWTTALPIGSPLLMTTVGLVTLRLVDIPPSTYFPPSFLLTRLSLMPQLEKLEIGFYSPLPNRDVERQPLGTPIITHITLPNLRMFLFNGVSAYLEGLLAQIRAPVLSELDIMLFSQLTFTLPRLLLFMGTFENLGFNTVKLVFRNNDAQLVAYQLGERKSYPFKLQIMCRHLDWQVSSAAQILNTLQPILSGVEKLTLIHGKHYRSSEWHNEVDRTQWHQLLRPFSNLKTLYVQNELVGKLARSLHTDDGDPPPELLSLEKVGYSGGRVAQKALTPFIDERRVTGHPVKLTVVASSEFFLLS